MPEDEYDLAGFTVGVVDKKDIITGENLKAGDVLIGMASSGVHSNGFSLVRKIFKMDRETLNTYVDELGKTLGEALLAPTRIYVGAMKSIKNAGVRVKACSHITGGGFYENIPRMLPEGKHAVIEKNSYPIPPIFTLMAKASESMIIIAVLLHHLALALSAAGFIATSMSQRSPGVVTCSLPMWTWKPETPETVP